MSKTEVLPGEEEERIVAGGATSFPRIEPRPKYPSASEILPSQLIRTFRGPALAVLVARYLVHPLFKKLAEWWVKEKGLSESTLFAFSSTAVHVILYAVCNGTFLLMDQNEWLQEYKLARKPSQIPTHAQIVSVIKDFIIGIPPAFLGTIGLFHLYQRLGAPGVLDELPSNTKMLWDFIVANYFNIFGFYFAHRFVHSKQLYKIIHKQHHIFVGTVSVAAENASPVEQVAANMIPTIGGCLLMRAHPVVWLTYLIWRLEETYESHSGYCFAGTFLHNIGLTNADSAAFHDHHHVENKGNFGFEFSDWLFGTMDHWVSIGRMEGYVKRAREAYKARKEQEKLEQMKSVA